MFFRSNINSLVADILSNPNDPVVVRILECLNFLKPYYNNMDEIKEYFYLQLHGIQICAIGESGRMFDSNSEKICMYVVVGKSSSLIDPDGHPAHRPLTDEFMMYFEDLVFDRVGDVYRLLTTFPVGNSKIKAYIIALSQIIKNRFPSAKIKTDINKKQGSRVWISSY